MLPLLSSCYHLFSSVITAFYFSLRQRISQCGRTSGESYHISFHNKYITTILRRLQMRRYILSDILTASALVLLVSFSTTIVQIALAQGNLSVRPSSNTTFSPAAVKDLMQQNLFFQEIGT
jgi:hypothetical protein